MLHEIIIQGLGILAFLAGISAFLSKNDTSLKFLIGISGCLLAIHFFLMGAYVGSGAAFFAATRSFISIFKSAKPYAPLFFLAYIPLGYFCIHDWIDILPICAGLIGTYYMFYKEGTQMRCGLLITSSFWLTHNILQGSIGGILLEIFYLSANTKTILLLKKEAKNNSKPSQQSQK